MEPSSTKRAEDLRPDMLEFVEVRLLVWNRFGDASSRTPGVGGLGKGKPCLLILTKETLSLEEVLRVEREWRPTTADEGGVEGWVRLMASRFIEAVPEGEREAVVREIVETLEYVCAKPGGGYMISYVRLRVLARKI